MSDEDFEITVVESPKIEPDLPREKLLSLVKLLEDLGWEKSKFKRYVSTALRLRNLEKRYGKTYISLVKSYEKLSSEEVKLRYAIDQLLEKRRRVEEDLKLYLEQRKLTLELIQRLEKLIAALRERGLDLEDLEKALNVLESMKGAGYDLNELLGKLGRLKSLEGSIKELEERIRVKAEELERLEDEKRKLLKEIGEAHGIYGDLEDLRRSKERAGREVEEVEKKLEESRLRLEKVRAELEELLGRRVEISQLKEEVESLRRELEELRSERDRVAAELSELLNARNEIEDIRRRFGEYREKLSEIEREIANRQSYLEILEGEIAAAYAILKIFTDPQGVEAEDLEPLVEHLQRILKSKRGELPALKPLEPHLLNRVRDSLVSLIAPYVKSEFVPRKVFEKLEKELRKLNERRQALEEELASLKKLLESKRVEEIKPSEPKLEAFTPEGKPVELKTLGRGRRFRIVCPACGSSAIIGIPIKEELEELSTKNYTLKFTCGNCGRSFDLPIDVLLKKLEA